MIITIIIITTDVQVYDNLMRSDSEVIYRDSSL